MKHTLPTETINKILVYLGTKAYSEVAQLVEEIKAKAEAFIEPAAPTVVAPTAPVTK